MQPTTHNRISILAIPAWPLLSVVRSAGAARVAWKASNRSDTRSTERPAESVASSDRFFPATILGGHLHVRGTPDWGPWDSSRFEWADEEFVDMILSKTTGDRKARTREELEAAIVSGATSGRSWRTMIGRVYLSLQINRRDYGAHRAHS